MTEDEGIKLLEVVNSFWHKLGALAAEHIDMMPEHLQDSTTMSLQDSCSIYSTEYSKYLADIKNNKKETK